MTTRTNMSKYIKRSGIHSPMRLRGKNILFNCDLGFNPCSVLIICIYIITTSPVEDSLSSLRMSLAGQKKCNHQRWWLRSWKLRSFSCLASVQNYFLRFSMSVFVHALIISISDIDIFLIIFYRGFIFPYFHFSQAPEWETYGWHRILLITSISTCVVESPGCL